MTNAANGRWDGTGYPTHAEIVDTLRFDALMSRRAYKDAWEPGAVRAEIERSSGTHFDPELVELFLADFDEYVRLHSLIGD